MCGHILAWPCITINFCELVELVNVIAALTRKEFDDCAMMGWHKPTRQSFVASTRESNWRRVARETRCATNAALGLGSEIDSEETRVGIVILSSSSDLCVPGH